MPIVTACTGCNKKIRVADKLAGKFVKCPHCAQKVKVTAEPDGPKSSGTPTTKAKSPVSKSSVAAAKPVLPAKTTLAKTTPAKPTSPMIAGKPVPVKKKPQPVKEEEASDTTIPPPRAEPKREVQKPKPPSPRDDDDEDSGKSRLKLLLAGAGTLAVIGLVVMYVVFFSEPPLGNVTGKIQFDGQPLDQAAIVFVSADGPNLGRPFQSTTSKGGEYRLYGQTGKGVPPGKYKIVVSKMVMPDGKVPQGPEGEIAREKDWLRELIPADYSKVEKTKLDADVRAGNNTLDFSIPKSP